MGTLLLRGATVVTMNPKREIVSGDVWVEDGRIGAVGKGASKKKADKALDLSGKILLPGFVQGHIHLCQTLFRNRAEELALLDWLSQWIWPLEASHTEKTIRASARLGLCELIDSGVTTILDMGTVHHTEHVFDEIEKSGIRALCGKAMMDYDPEGIVPMGLREKTKRSIEESLALLKAWHGKANGRIHYAFAPRFALSCTKDCLQEVGRLSKEHESVVHTHASENKGEVELVKKLTGSSNIKFLDEVGLTQHHLAVAHAVHLEKGEIEILKKRAGVLHCPGSNLKLASGIAPIPQLRKAKVAISLGSDAGACNNRLDIFREMFLAAALQKVQHGPAALPPLAVLEMATIEGARALNLHSQIGSIEIGKKADFVALDLENFPSSSPSPDLYASLVYSADPRNVHTVICDGEILKRDGKLTRYDSREIAAKARDAWRSLSR